VRSLALSILLLVMLCQVAVQLDTGARPSATEAVPRPWVRTIHGWEQLDSPQADALSQIELHPCIVAAGLFCSSLLALLVWDRGR
jgi:hypothetical protein